MPRSAVSSTSVQLPSKREALEILPEIRGRRRQQGHVDLASRGAQFAPAQTTQQQVGRGIVLIFAAQKFRRGEHAGDGVAPVRRLGRERSAGFPGARRRGRGFRGGGYLRDIFDCGLGRFRLRTLYGFVRFLLPLLLEEHADSLLDFLEGIAQGSKAGCHILEFLGAELVQSL